MFGRNFTMGYINNKEDGIFAILSPWHYNGDDLPVYALDKISKINKDTKIVDDEDLQTIIDGILKKIKEQRVLFDSYETLEIIKSLTMKWITC